MTPVIFSRGVLAALFTWAQQFPPHEANQIEFTHLRPQLTTRLRAQWDIRMVPSDLEFRCADLTGDVFQVRNDWTIMQLLEEYRPEWRIRQYNYRELHKLAEQFAPYEGCKKPRKGHLQWRDDSGRARMSSLHCPKVVVLSRETNVSGYL